MESFANYNPTNFQKAVAGRRIMVECGDVFVRVTRASIMTTIRRGNIKTVSTFTVENNPGGIYVTALLREDHNDFKPTAR